MIGRTIAHYRILEKLGEGGMGVVYRAEDTRLQRIVALKFLSPRLADQPDEYERCLREARILASFDHPHLLTIHEIGDDAGRPFLVTACVEGSSLKELIRAGGLDRQRAAGLALQIAGGLAAAHERGVVHGDIKPSNILLTEDGQARVADFGLARRRGDEDD